MSHTYPSIHPPSRKYMLEELHFCASLLPCLVLPYTLCNPPASVSMSTRVQAVNEVQRSGAELFVLEDIDFGRRLAVEREMAGSEVVPPPNAVFDESGNFLM